MLVLNSLAFIFCILSIAGPFVKYPSGCDRSHNGGRHCGWYDDYVFPYSSRSGTVTAGAWIMAAGFVCFVPCLVLSTNLFHKRDRHDTRIPFRLAAFHFITTVVSLVCSVMTTVFYFMASDLDFEYARVVIGPVMALVAAVLYLAVLVLLLICYDVETWL
ncbi:hypothetical protein ADEAN_000128700 [Angomonas deanei]|uniref:Amastin surface glycoprotein n=1 Tax=Angomonas deanei TaxID=59799 RepID=A0A7G2C3K1_9TRYP|nr:hypothetical protein ADEAN_000128700 [Angomonas deanei]